MSALEDRIRIGLDADREVPELLDAIHRGARRRQVRRTAGAAGAAALAVAALATGIGLSLGEDDRDTPRTVDQPTTVTDPTTTALTELPFGALTIAEQDAVLTDLLRTWQEVLATRLDPTSEHLVTDPDLEYRRFTPSGTKPTPYDEIPWMVDLPKLGWENAGESGTGSIQLAVFARWVDAKYQMPCMFLETPCRRFEVDTARQAFHGSFADHPSMGDGFFVALQREDGTSVVITVTSLFGNNTQIPVSGTGLTRAALVDVALDPLIALP